MSNKSIVITEKQIVDAMDEMCCESLCPEYHDAWEKIVTCLKETRPALANYPQEIFPGTMEALNEQKNQNEAVCGGSVLTAVLDAAAEYHKFRVSGLSIDDEQLAILDDLADLFEYWKRSRSNGRTPNAIRRALVLLASDIAKITDSAPNDDVTGLAPRKEEQ